MRRFASSRVREASAEARTRDFARERDVRSRGDSESERPVALVPRAFAKHAGRRTHAASCRDEADDLENLACEWRGDARTMRGISVLNFARRSWQRVTRPRPLLDVVRVAMTFGFDFEWSLEWSVSLSHLSTYLFGIGIWFMLRRVPPPKFSAAPSPPNADLDSSLEVSTLLWIPCLFGCAHRVLVYALDS